MKKLLIAIATLTSIGFATSAIAQADPFATADVDGDGQLNAEEYAKFSETTPASN